jgi:hypothetical protein
MNGHMHISMRCSFVGILSAGRVCSELREIPSSFLGNILIVETGTGAYNGERKWG